MPEDRFADANGINLHYLEWPGSGPTILCLHGITGHAHAWDGVAAALSPRYRVIAIDQRGHGESDKPEGGYSTAGFAADLEAFAQTLKLAPFTLMGHSMGARNAAMYAGTFPDRLTHLILEDPPSPFGQTVPPGHNPILERESNRPDTFTSLEEAVDFMGGESDVLATQPRRERVSQEFLRRYAVDALRQRPDGRWEWRYSRAAIQQIIRTGLDMGTGDQLAAMGKIKVPTLLVSGGESNVCTAETAARFQEVIPNCELVCIPGVAHAVHAEKQDEFLAAVRAFLGVR